MAPAVHCVHFLDRCVKHFGGEILKKKYVTVSEASGMIMQQLVMAGTYMGVDIYISMSISKNVCTSNYRCIELKALINSLNYIFDQALKRQ